MEITQVRKADVWFQYMLIEVTEIWNTIKMSQKSCQWLLMTNISQCLLIFLGQQNNQSTFLSCCLMRTLPPLKAVVLSDFFPPGILPSSSRSQGFDVWVWCFHTFWEDSPLFLSGQFPSPLIFLWSCISCSGCSLRSLWSFDWSLWTSLWNLKFSHLSGWRLFNLSYK